MNHGYPHAASPAAPLAAVSAAAAAWLRRRCQAELHRQHCLDPGGALGFLLRVRLWLAARVENTDALRDKTRVKTESVSCSNPMRASDQQCEGLSAHLSWRSAIARRRPFKSASLAAVRAASNAGSGGSSSGSSTIPRKILRLRKMFDWLCCMAGDDQRRRLRQPGERVQNLQQQRMVRRQH